MGLRIWCHSRGTSITNVEKGPQKFLLHTLADLAKALQVEPASLLPGPAAEPEQELDDALKNRPRSEQEWVKSAVNAATGEERRWCVRKHIRSLVESLLAQHGVRSVPVPVTKIANALGVRVQQERAEKDLSGFLYRDRKRRLAVIGVNADHNPKRQRFTTAHELGHFLLP